MNEVEKIWEIREVKWVFQHKNQIIAAIGIIQASRFFLKIVNYIIQYRRHKKFALNFPLDTVPGIFGFLPKLAELIDSNSDYHDHRLDRIINDGPIRSVDMGFYHAIVVAEPNLAKFLLNLPPDITRKSGITSETFESDTNGFKEGLIMDEGELWQLHRKSISKMLHLEVLEHYIEHMEVSAVAFTEILTKTDKPLDTEEVFDKCARFTFEIICKCLMGDVNNDTQTSMTFDRIFKAINQLSDMMVWRMKKLLVCKLAEIIPFGMKYLEMKEPVLSVGVKAVKVRDDYLNEQIKIAKDRIRHGDETYDLTSMLLKDKDANGKSKFTLNQVRCQVYTFLFAGHETSASCLQWILFFLGKNPDWVEIIREEFDNIGRQISVSSLKKTPKTEAFIKETLRLAHIADVYIPRCVTKDVLLPNGLTMPKGFEYTVDIGAMLYNDEIFPEPRKFNPNRFLNNEMKDADPYWFIPFAAGRRNCIGQLFAMQELKIVLLYLSSNVKITNKIVDPDKHFPDHPPRKLEGLTYKLKPNSLLQSYSCQ